MKTTSFQLKLKHTSVAFLCAAVLAVFSVGTNAQSSRTSDQFSQQQQLTAADGAALDQFGAAVAISGDTAIVGAPYDTVGANFHQGSVYVFTRSGNTWTQQAQLFANDGAAGDEFGWSVAIDGDTIVVGADADDVFANADQGSAYVFFRSGTTWTQQAHLFANDGSARDHDYFGNSVAIQGDTVIVGAYLNDSFHVNQGSAYVFVRSGTTWTLQQHLFAADGTVAEEFGSAVALDSDTAAVGAWSDTISGNTQQGSTYVFVRAGTTWTQQAKLTAADGHTQDFFGGSVAISADTILVGSDWHDIGSNGNQGAAYVFIRTGASWSQQQQLTASDGAASDEFGHAVAILGDTAVVGAWLHDVASALDEGSAYTFTRSGTTWTQEQELAATDSAAGDQFGTSVALSGNTVIAGAWADVVGANANQGTATIFASLTPTLHVANIVTRYQPQGAGDRVLAQISIQDALGTNVSSAIVSVDVTLPNAQHRTTQVSTNTSGKAKVSFVSSLHGTFTFCVTDVTKTGYIYDSSQNVETCDGVIIP